MMRDTDDMPDGHGGCTNGERVPSSAEEAPPLCDIRDAGEIRRDGDF